VNQASNLHQSLNDVDSLPDIPDLARKILSLNLTNDEDVRTLLELIEKDPSILPGIISLSNSLLFSSGRKIMKMEDAVISLGSKLILMLALSISIISSMTRKPAGLLNIQSLWKHSLAVAMTMETLARSMPQDRRPSDYEIYLAGLLHDIGFLVLDYLDPQLSDRFHARLAAEPKYSIEEVEAEMLETDHGELGAMLGRRWNLPAPIIASMNYHHAPEVDQTTVASTLVALASLAEKMLPTFGFTESSALKDIAIEEWQSLGIDSDRMSEIKSKAQKIVLEVTTTKF